MTAKKTLIVGGGIAGLTAAIALTARGVKVDIVEQNPRWMVHGVGIIQQANVTRAMQSIGLLREYLSIGFPFDSVTLFDIEGREMARVPSPRLAGPDIPANLGISRLALHKVLHDGATRQGANLKLGVTFKSFIQDQDKVRVQFTDGGSGVYDLMIGADGLYSKTRTALFGVASPRPKFFGQGVWRYNFPLDPEVDGLQATSTPEGNAGLVPLANNLMYLYVTTEEPGNPRYEGAQLAETMRAKMAPFKGRLAQLRAQITDPTAVFYKPIETVFVTARWFKGRVVLIGDAAHGTSPHMGQGAGLAVEDSVVLAEELAHDQTVAQALAAFQERRYERCREVCEISETVGRAELEKTSVDRGSFVRRMVQVTAQPI